MGFHRTAWTGCPPVGLRGKPAPLTVDCQWHTTRTQNGQAGWLAGSARGCLLRVCPAALSGTLGVDFSTSTLHRGDSFLLFQPCGLFRLPRLLQFILQLSLHCLAQRRFVGHLLQHSCGNAAGSRGTGGYRARPGRRRRTCCLRRLLPAAGGTRPATSRASSTTSSAPAPTASATTRPLRDRGIRQE